ncbi:M28 family peptidase [Sporosarcina sp. Marseille-Q4063]|uniref:M28 family peptidase n=1 Tax=Sporosarcina sp. Marseille-Q4063 TaxID=2810514 RepID=UPI001BAEF8BD|nr:M28 family peptidase [Sporosarcina sp. Marseille-Q4063]QUW23175.1 M28 family peptidase [Sporosarcina sp. Marseille-Q4063]
MVRKALYIPILLVFSIFISACSPPVQEVISSSTDNVDSAILDNLDVEKIYSNVKELSKEPRIAGTDSEKNAANFITSQLETFGYAVESQPFEFDHYIFPKLVELTIDGIEQSFSPEPFQYSVSGNVTGTLINVNNGLTSDYEDIDVKGKIAVASISDIYFEEMVLNAAEAGAVGVIINFADGLPNTGWSLGKHHDDFIPTIALSPGEGKSLLNLIRDNESVTGTITIEGADIEKHESQNIIVTKPSKTSNDEIVVVGAHYDSVETSPGASDNASGTAVLLEIARVLESVSTDKELRFLFFGAEELGLFGSEKYVDEMTKSEIKRTDAMLNMDMVGSVDAGPLTMFTVDGFSNTVTDTAKTIKKIPLEFTDRSDHKPFHNAGIDAALFSYFPSEEWYHSPQDTIDQISKDRLDEVASLVTASVLKLSTNNYHE